MKSKLQSTILNVNACHSIIILHYLHLPFLFHYTGFDTVPKLEKDSDLDDANSQLEAGLGLPSDGFDEETSKNDGMLGGSSNAKSISGESGKVSIAMDPVVAMGADFVSLEKDSDIIGE